MFRKILVVIFLAIGLGGFLFFRKYLNKPIPAPLLIDRIPDGDFLAQVKLLEVSKDASDLLFYNKLPFRDMFSYDFILGKAKGFGIDVQNPAYFFADEDGDWGAMLKVVDSSKVGNGVLGLQKNIILKRKEINSQMTYQIGNDSTFFAYGKDWLFFYSGGDFEEKINHVTQSYKGSVSKKWRNFLEDKAFDKKPFIVYSDWKKIEELGIESVILSLSSDSVSVQADALFRSEIPWGYDLKSEGIGIKHKVNSKNIIHLHLQNQNLNEPENTVFYKLIASLGKRISFPTDEFIKAWNGDLSIEMGGMQTIKEKYIVSEMDDNFEITEVVKYQDIEVPGFSVLLSLNKQKDVFVNRLFAKGIVTKDEAKYRVLFSPPLNLRLNNDYMLFYSGDFAPKITNEINNQSIWYNKNTTYQMSIDSLKTYELYGKVKISVEDLLNGRLF